MSGANKGVSISSLFAFHCLRLLTSHGSVFGQPRRRSSLPPSLCLCGAFPIDLSYEKRSIFQPFPFIQEIFFCFYPVIFKNFLLVTCIFIFTSFLLLFHHGPLPFFLDFARLFVSLLSSLLCLPFPRPSRRNRALS